MWSPRRRIRALPVRDVDERSDPPAQPPRNQSTVPTVTIMDSTQFVLSVKLAFIRERAKYLEFIHILSQFHRRRISREDVISQLHAVLEGHPDLIRRFNEFMPSQYRTNIQYGEQASVE